MKSHGCQFCEDGDRRPASRIRARSAAGIGRPSKDRTLRREVIASQVCMPVSTPALPRSFSAPILCAHSLGPLSGPCRVWALIRFAEEGTVPVVIDTVAWVRLENGRILCARPRGNAVFYIPGSKRQVPESDAQTRLRA